VASIFEYGKGFAVRQKLFGTAALVLSILLLAAATGSAQAQTYTTLFSFQAKAGEYPVAGVVIDSAGNLYGTTQQGGAHGLGTIFKVDANGKETVLHSFSGGKSDGAYPTAGLAFDSKGNLYGTTELGGTWNRGTVFKVSKTTSVLYSFKATGGDGVYPISGVVLDKAGNIYGTTQQGGTRGYGTVFKLSAAGKESVLHSFKNIPDGAYPCAGLILDAKGNLYGTTQLGGAPQNDGTVFKLSSSGKETVLHRFTYTKGDGAYPIGGVVRDKSGNLYGTASDGGAFGIGIVFKLNSSGHQIWSYSFGTNNGDGLYPFAGLVRDAEGNLYGTAELGGANGPGTVFKVTSSGEESTLYSFTGSDGADPLSGLVLDSGNLYGTTPEGGAHGKGVVFKLTP
jgi:uncharacterized repeat protein (TIGR03803 family)